MISVPRGGRAVHPQRHQPSMSRLYVVQRIRFGLSGYSSSAESPPSVVAIAHPWHHIDIQLVRSHLVERGLGGMSVRAWRSIITA